MLIKSLIKAIPVNEIIQRFGTPAYVYSASIIEYNWKAIHDTFARYLTFSSPIVAYAVKANSHLAILHNLVKMGSSFDVVSGGELQRVLTAGGAPKKIFFSGVGKTEKEILDAIRLDIACIHVESIEELERIERLAKENAPTRLNRPVPIALRINPNVNPKTHPYIATGLKENKFGIPLEEAKAIYKNRSQYPHLSFIGLASHIGSQILDLEPYLEALNSLLALYDELVQDGLVLEHLDLGGGFGITYTDEKPLDIDALAQAVAKTIGSRPITLMIEPGRSIVGNAGILLTKVEYLKDNEDKHFAIVDAGMNDLLRPALYQATHPIEYLDTHYLDTREFSEPFSDTHALKSYDIVGPICETGDFLAKNQLLPATLKAGDYLAVGITGAYGFSMSSHYNSRPKAAEVLVDGDEIVLIRARETFEDLIRGEMMGKSPLPPFVKGVNHSWRLLKGENSVTFVKMHALGNDFLVLDGVNQSIQLTQQLLQKLSDRHRGIGFDQCLLIEKPLSTDTDFFYSIFNADGSEVGQCGNGARCVARFIHEQKLSLEKKYRLATKTTQINVEIHDEGYQKITAELGVPRFLSTKLETTQDLYTQQLNFRQGVSEADEGVYNKYMTEVDAAYNAAENSSAKCIPSNPTNISFHALDIGNPHAVIRVQDIHQAPVDEIGQLFNTPHFFPLFPEGVNVGFMEIQDSHTIKLRVFERGVGETQACGSGACAAMICARKFYDADATITIEFYSQLLETENSDTQNRVEVSWQGDGCPVFITGDAVDVFEGTFEC